MERASASNSAAGASDYATFSTAPYFPVPFHLQRPDTVPTSQPQSMDQQYPKPYLPPPQPPAVKIPGVAPVYPAAYPATASAVPGVYSLPQYQQAQQLFQRDAQTITPEALESVKAALASSEVDHKAEIKKKAIPRKAAGQTWEDPTLTDWPENDFRLFCGDLGNEVNDDVLSKAFSRFPSFNMARVVRDKRTGKTRGYGFVSFANPTDLAAALKEMNGKYVGNRPIKLRKSTWKERTDINALERQKNHSQKKLKQPRKGILHK
uniref:RNA-binding protein 42 n=1 Tax=Anthurium amnicola TaxID=1678845 RepID=A0A1D1Z8E8_9ARAE